MADPKNDSDDEYNSEDEDPEKKLTPEQMNAMLMEAVHANNFEGAQDAIRIGADVNCEENGWSPLLWAACNGNEDIVRLLIKNHAHHKYKKDPKEPKIQLQTMLDKEENAIQSISFTSANF